MSGTFKGMYYKHQKDGVTLAVITGRADSGPFVQILTDERTYCYETDKGCLAGKYGVALQLPAVRGAVRYGPLLPLHGDIMGPFRIFPMQCRHTVQSMAHSLRGGFWVEGRYLDFTGGTGYIEGDSGRSFPREYLWLHCNAFPAPCSIMASVADIPFGGGRFTGCICAVWYAGREYRLATYRGVRIIAANCQRLILSQGGCLLMVDIDPRRAHALRAPLGGAMTQTIHESSCTQARFRFWAHGAQLFDLSSEHVSFECNLGGAAAEG